MKKNNRLAFKRPTPRFRHQGPPEYTPDIWDIWVELTPEQKRKDISLLIGLLFSLIIFIVGVSL
jgi:hypothetical protein